MDKEKDAAAPGASKLKTQPFESNDEPICGDSFYGASNKSTKMVRMKFVCFV